MKLITAIIKPFKLQEVREALVNRANEAYAPGDPKRMRLDDDETLEAYIQSKKQMGAEDELIEDITDFIGMPPPSPGMQKIIQEEMRRARSLYDEIAEDEIALAKVPNIPFAILLSKIILILSLSIF